MPEALLGIKTQLGSSSSRELLKLASAKASGDFIELLLVLLKWTGEGWRFYQRPDIRGMHPGSQLLGIVLILGAVAESWEGGWGMLLGRGW